jgi:biotin operon repressor
MSVGRRAVLAARRQLNLTQKAISNSIKTLERDGVLAEQAGHPLHAFATGGLWLSGKGIGQ